MSVWYMMTSMNCHAHTGVGVEIIGHQERAIRRYRHAHTGVGVEIQHTHQSVTAVIGHAHTGVGVEIAVQWLRGCKFWSRPHGRGSRNHMSFCRPSAPARHAHTGVGE